MSVTLATVADALIEFILSLLRDPAVAAEFDADPDAALQARGLQHVTAADVCSVAPVVIERPQIIPAPAPPPPPPAHHPDGPSVIREIKAVTNNFSWVDDRDTIVDQSVNQNIWAHGDVTQHFDNDAVVASGDDAIAAGDDVDVDQSEDNSTTITAGNDANVGNETTTTEIDGSFNEETDASTTTDNSTDVETDGSFNDSSTTETNDGSYNDSAAQYTETNTDVDANVVYDSSDTVIVDDSTADDGL